MAKTRIDQWLWSVRIYKTRTKATDACKSSRVTIDGHVVKPSKEVELGNHIIVRKRSFKFEYRVLDLKRKRVSATLAALCYEDVTPDEELQKYESWYAATRKTEFRDKGQGRPTKRERRKLDDYKEDL